MKVDVKPQQIGNQVASKTDVTFSVTGLSGWIVQKITHDWSKVLNDSSNTNYTPSNPPTQTYWEAWHVASGIIDFGGVDQWGSVGFPDSTHGEYVMSGKFDFYSYTAVTGSSPTSWGNQASESGLLKSTTTQPTWWTGNGTDRNLKMTWE